MNLAFFPRYYSESLDFKHLKDSFASFDPVRFNEVVLAAQISVNGVLGTLCQDAAADGNADTFLAFNPALFEGKGYVLFNLTVQLHYTDESLKPTTCTILFKYGAAGLAVVPTWTS